MSRPGPRAPHAVCVGGPPGAGKSTLGVELASALGAALLDQDTVTNPLLQAFCERDGAPFDLDSPLVRSLREARYRCVLETAADNAGAGVSSVVVAPFTAEGRDSAGWYAAAALAVPAAAHLVWLTVDAATAAARRQARSLARDRGVDDAGGTGRHTAPAHACLTLDGTAPAVANVAAILDHLQRQPEPGKETRR